MLKISTVLLSSRIQGPSVLDFVCSDSSVSREQRREGSHRLLVAKQSPPSESSVLSFIGSDSCFLSSSARTESSSPVKSKYDLNWTNPGDYIKHWHVLSKDDQSSLKKLFSSDLASNSNRFGLKRLNLETHLLLNIGCDMTNIVGNGKDSVATNLKGTDGLYNDKCLDSRAVDAKTCLKAYRDFKRDYDPSILLKKGFVAFQAVVSPDSSFRISESNMLESKAAIQEFFKQNSDAFRKLHKRKRIYSYIYSHEISVDSIVGKLYRPHSHLVFFLPKESADLLAEKTNLLTEEFNSLFSDRSISLDKIESSSGFVPRTITRADALDRTVGYLYRAYSLAPQYMREIRSDNISSLNKSTVECYRNLIWLFRSEEANGLKGVRRVGSSTIPETGAGKQYVHPLLQKKKKSNTIREEKSKKNKFKKAYAQAGTTSDQSNDASSDRSIQQGGSLEIQQDCNGARPGLELFRGSVQRTSGSSEECKAQRAELSTVSQRRAEKDERRRGKSNIFRRGARPHHFKSRKLSKSGSSRVRGCMEWSKGRTLEEWGRRGLHRRNTQRSNGQLL